MKIFLAILLTAVVIGAPLGYFAADRFSAADKFEMQNAVLENQVTSLQDQVATAQVTNEPLFYDLGNLNVTVKKSSVKFTDLFTASDLNARKEDCGETAISSDYFDNLVGKFEGQTGYKYSFTSKTDADETYVVTLFPNAPSYTSLSLLEDDFQACSVGLSSPRAMNSKWLMFGSPCSAGYGGELPTLACADISQKLTLEFN